jgi:hypothetical protein
MNDMNLASFTNKEEQLKWGCPFGNAMALLKALGVSNNISGSGGSKYIWVRWLPLFTVS